MSGQIVTCTQLDSVRIEVLGEGRALTLPAGLILAADEVLRYERIREADLTVTSYRRGDDVECKATLGASEIYSPSGYGPTPWAAILALAERLEKGR